ncbi:MAG: aspartate aminotransferase family protein [bacterium]
MKLKDAEELDKKYIFPTYRRTPLLITRGKGNYLFDEKGNKYLDLVSGLAVNALGHCERSTVAAISKQAARLMHVSNLYYTEPMLHLAEKLTKLSGMEKVFFANSGAEANEAAIKLVRKYSREKFGADRYEIICFKNGFHGRTLTTLTATGQQVYRKGFEPLTKGFRHAVYNDLKSVEKVLTKKTCAIMVEPVQGEAGIYVADTDFIKGLDALRRERGLQLIFDEVQCGLGRTGRWFAFQHYGVKPDVLTLAKSLGGGLPLGAMSARGAVTSAFVPGSHASTFGANPVICAAALEFLSVMEKKKLVQKAGELGKYAAKKLNSLKKQNADIKDVRALGLMIAVDIQQNAKEAANFFRENGILVNPIREHTIRILPPLTITKVELDRFVILLDTFLSL